MKYKIMVALASLLTTAGCMTLNDKPLAKPVPGATVQGVANIEEPLRLGRGSGLNLGYALAGPAGIGMEAADMRAYGREFARENGVEDASIAIATNLLARFDKSRVLKPISLTPAMIADDIKPDLTADHVLTISTRIWQPYHGLAYDWYFRGIYDMKLTDRADNVLSRSTCVAEEPITSKDGLKANGGAQLKAILGRFAVKCSEQFARLLMP